MVTPRQFSRLAASRNVDVRADATDALQVRTDELRLALDLVEELNLVVLGLDGLKEDGAVIVPLIDYIADFGEIEGAWPERVRASVAAARAVGVRWFGGPDIVELILDGLDE